MFLIHDSINDLEKEQNIRFPNDMKISERTCCDEDILILQRDIDRLGDENLANGV